MKQTRRSGRIAKEFAIVLLGTDTMGKVFLEETTTVVLSRHGAGVVSRYRFSPDEVLTLRLRDSLKEAAVRFVGQIGGEPGRYIHGVAFLDPDLKFWPMEFPPPEPFEPIIQQIALECSMCQAGMNMAQGDIEEDVYSVIGNILHYCEVCGTSTPWKKSESAATPDLSVSLKKPSPEVTVSSLSALTEATRSASRPATLTLESSLYSGTSAVEEFAHLAYVEAAPAVTSATVTLEAPEPANAQPTAQSARPATRPQDIPTRELDANGRPINKRRHVRIRVSFSACVRQRGSRDELVECENVSKGGVCFHSLQKYALNSLIEIAAPFSPGQTALFVHAQIKRIEPLSGGEVFRYGIEYLLLVSTKPFS